MLKDPSISGRDMDERLAAMVAECIQCAAVVFESSAQSVIQQLPVLEQVANILCAQVNSASYPQRAGK